MSHADPAAPAPDEAPVAAAEVTEPQTEALGPAPETERVRQDDDEADEAPQASEEAAGGEEARPAVVEAPPPKEGAVLYAPVAYGDDAMAAAALLDEGLVVVCVALAAHDCIAAEPPMPLYFALPRASLLCAVWQPVAAAFQPSVADFGGDGLQLWLSAGAGDDALAWHYPAGVLCDALRLHSGVHPPVMLTAHVGRPPKKAYLLSVTRPRDVVIFAQQALKMAAVSLFDEVAPFYRLSPQQTDAITARAIALDATTTARTATGAYYNSVDELVKHGGGAVKNWLAVAHTEHGPVTRLVPARAAGERPPPEGTPEAREAIFADLLLAVLGPATVGTEGCNLRAFAQQVAARTADPGAPLPATPEGPFRHPTVEVVFHGIGGVGGVPLETPLGFVVRHMSGFDLALHIAVRGLPPPPQASPARPKKS